MATIGLDGLYYAKITEDANGDETYGTPTKLAKAISADLEVEINEASLYADDAEAEVVKEFKTGKLTLGINDIGATAAGDLVGAVLDDNGVVISQSEGMASPVAIGFRAKIVTESIATSGSTGCCSVSRRRTSRPKATASRSTRRRSRVRSTVGTRSTGRANIRGRPRSMRTIRACCRRRSPGGIRKCTSRPLRLRNNGGNVWITNEPHLLR